MFDMIPSSVVYGRHKKSVISPVRFLLFLYNRNYNRNFRGTQKF